MEPISYCGSYLKLVDTPLDWKPSSEFSNPAEEITYRVLAGLHMGTTAMMASYTYYSRRQTERANAGLTIKNLIKDLGRLDGEKLFVATKKKVSHETPFICTAGAMYSSEYGHFASSPVRLNNGSRVNHHALKVAQTGQWILDFLRKKGNTKCLFYPEMILRQHLHWSSSADDSDRETYFLTTIPDAWILIGRSAIRLEVQLSRSKLDRIEAVLNDPSHPDHILYVTTSSSIAKTIRKIGSRKTFHVIELYNNAQLGAWLQEFAAWYQVSAYIHDPLRAHYSSPYFLHLMLNGGGTRPIRVMPKE
jgi:hypothetical protein